MTVHQDCPGVLQVRMQFTDDGQEVENIFHVGHADLSPWSIAQMDAVKSQFDTYWTAVRPQLASTVSLYQYTMTDLTSLAGLRKIYQVDPPEAGTNVSPQLPLNATKSLQLNTSSRGKGTNGKFYIPTLSESQVTDNDVSSAVTSAWITAVNNLIAFIKGDFVINGFLCVLSRYLGNARRPTGIAKEILTCAISNSTVDTQKNRLPMHKKHKRRAIV